jgi:hypothetical protein
LTCDHQICNDFIYLQYVLAQKIDLQRTFVGPKWMASKRYRTIKVMEINAFVLNDGLWNDAEEIILVIESLVQVLRY